VAVETQPPEERRFIMKTLFMAFLVVGVIGVGPCGAMAAAGDSAEDTGSHGALHQVVMYLPNRLLDAFDIVRLRVRVGPGIAADVRATKVASAFAGSYATVYAGLPGPRNRPLPKLPIGVESRSGLQISLADAAVEDGVGPDYGPAEIGAGVQVVMAGIDVGIDPLEILDLVAGFFFIDLRGDDL
jgi:hypothetical protein